MCIMCNVINHKWWLHAFPIRRLELAIHNRYLIHNPKPAIDTNNMCLVYRWSRRSRCYASTCWSWRRCKSYARTSATGTSPVWRARCRARTSWGLSTATTRRVLLTAGVPTTATISTTCHTITHRLGHPIPCCETMLGHSRLSCLIILSCAPARLLPTILQLHLPCLHDSKSSPGSIHHSERRSQHLSSATSA